MFAYPHHLAMQPVASTTTATLVRSWPLIFFPTTFIALPVKRPEISHYGNCSYIISYLFEKLQHLAVKSLIERTMSVQLHNVFGFRKPTSQTGCSSLAYCFMNINNVYSWVLWNRRFCPSSIQYGYNFSISFYIF